MYLKKIASLSCFLLFIAFGLYGCKSKTKSSSVTDTSTVEMRSGAATSSEMMTDTTLKDSTTAKP